MLGAHLRTTSIAATRRHHFNLHHDFPVTATHDFPFTVNESDFLQLFIRKRLECAISDGIGFHAKRDDISCICLGVFGDFEKHGETKKRMAYTL
jgi:hypothetical protein